MRKETYSDARGRLLRELSGAGYGVKPLLKVPQVKIDEHNTLFFQKQAVYLNNHSLFLDFRGMRVDDFMAFVNRIVQSRRECGVFQ